MTVDRPIVVALGAVDPALVTGVLGDGVTFVPDPSEQDIASAVGAIVRADAVVDAAFFERAPRLRVIARTGVGVDLVDLATASARGIPVVITPGSGTRAVAEGVFAMALCLVKRLGPLTDLVRQGRWAERGQVQVGDLDGATLAFARENLDLGGGLASSAQQSACGSWRTTHLARHPRRLRATTLLNSLLRATSSRCTYP